MRGDRILLDLGCGRRKHAGAIGIDNVPLETIDVVADLLSAPYPFATACADEVILSHVLEHFTFDEISMVLDEVHRILKPQGVLTISVPHALSVAFSSDPTHKTRFTFETFYYFTPQHAFSYYKQLHALWKIERLWASVNLVNDHQVAPGPWTQKVEHFVSRVMRYVVRRSRSTTLPDLVVKQFPFWLVNIHCSLTKAVDFHAGER